MIYPDLLPPEDDATYGKYGSIRRTYLREHHNGIYTGLLLSGKLTTHLNEIDETVNARKELLIKQMAQRQGIAEEPKARNTSAWVQPRSSRNVALEAFSYKLFYI